MKYFYMNDAFEDNAVTVVTVGFKWATIYRTGIKPYKTRRGANNYLRKIANHKIDLPEPDETILREDGENYDEFAERITGEMAGHIGYYEKLYPENPDAETLDKPKTFYKSGSYFVPAIRDLWYETEAEAKKDADGVTVIYLGPVEVYDPEAVKAIEEEIASYPA